MSNVNFLHETIEKIKKSGHLESDVIGVGSRNGELKIDWEVFKSISDFEYDKGFGGNEIPLELVVVFSDSTWLERHEYDGAEWWEYKKTPVFKSNAKTFSNVDDEWEPPWRSLGSEEQ